MVRPARRNRRAGIWDGGVASPAGWEKITLFVTGIILNGVPGEMVTPLRSCRSAPPCTITDATACFVWANMAVILRGLSAQSDEMV